MLLSSLRLGEYYLRRKLLSTFSNGLLVIRNKMLSHQYMNCNNKCNVFFTQKLYKHTTIADLNQILMLKKIVHLKGSWLIPFNSKDVDTRHFK